MVCLGNICRSPLAQGVMEEYIKENHLNWSVESAGTNGYHNGENPDPRAIKEAWKHGIDISKQISRQVQQRDLDEFDLILVMDSSNYNQLKSMCKNAQQLSKIYFLMDWAYPLKNKAVPDPYYDNSFSTVLNLIRKGCQALIFHFKNR